MSRSRNWSALDIMERTESVTEHYFRGLNVQSIARTLGAKQSEVQQIVDIIEHSAYRSETMSAFFEDLQQRTMEHLRALDEQLKICYAELDEARERIVKVNEFGGPVFEADPSTGLKTTTPMMVPRSAAVIPKLLKQIETLLKQKAEVLKLVGQKTDVTVKLQISHQVQTVILEFIQTLSPEIYAELYRQIEAIVPEAQAFSNSIIDVTPKELAA